MKTEVKQILERLYDYHNAPLVFFDIESTGLDKSTDEIIQLYMCKYDGKEFSEHNSYYNTDVPIRQEAFEKHGIKNEDLVKYPYFKADSQRLYEEFFSKGTILCGYNSNNFDIPFIIEKFIQSEITTAVSILQNKRIDVIEIYRELYPNTLEGVFDRLVGGDMGEAHEAKSDVVASIRILDKLLQTKGDYDVATTSNTIDLDKFFRRDGDEIFFNKGKLKDQNILTMNSKEALGFLKWMTRTDNISVHSKAIATRIITKIEKSLLTE
mgnify:CR=1 FL=1|tara:strand:- start:1549 stop:2349 length:801 start_codon:yes stop_codon:yes gene_type:complete